MADVYSTQLAFVAGFSGGPDVVAIVDALHVAVITCITTSVGVNAVPGATLVMAGPGMPTIYTYGQEATLLPVSDTQEGRWVLNPGDSIAIATSGGWTADFAISGFLLTAP